MNRMLTRAAVTTAFTLSLSAQAAAGAPALPQARLEQLKAQQSARVEQARTRLLGLRATLGLGAQAGFLPHDAFTNAQGRAVARFTQTHQGYRVWAGEAIVHVETDGRLRTLSQDVRGGITLEGSPRLTAEQARDIALRNLAPQGPLRTEPKVERVVFPSRYTGGLATRFDEEKRREVVDLEMSTWAHPPSAPYVWAYEVKTHLDNLQDGIKEYAYVIDGDTGAILRKWDELQGLSATGTGKGLYSGTVSLATTRSDVDGTYSLVASDRGSVVNPYLKSAFKMTQPGLMSLYQVFKTPQYSSVYSPFAGNTDNTWGDGQDFNGWDLCFSSNSPQAYLCGTPDTNGQTAGVDALHGLTTTWDLYQNVFGRNGIDGAGTSTFSVVHVMSMDWYGNTSRINAAYWAPSAFGLILGDGTSPRTASGNRSLTELDIVAHELTHGVTQSTARLLTAGEPGGVNESFSDIFAKMASAYARRPAGQDTALPDFAANDFAAWEVAAASNKGTPLRWMYKPSLDGLSPDAWFDGMEVLKPQFASGPMNRAFYFLAQGSSAAADSPTHSEYLPQGMAGIGNDRAARILYKTLTEHLTSSATYTDVRDAAIESATELFGEDSSEALAVTQAFAAVNVGSLPGEAPRVKVKLPVVHPAGTPLGGNNTSPAGILGKVQIFPTRTPVRVHAVVENTDNTAITWSVGAPQDGRHGGIINADGTWTTPMWPYSSEFLTLTATSQADPRMFAKGRFLAVEMDTDRDTETDALDLGAIAMAWGLTQAPYDSVLISGRSTAGDWDLVYFTEGFVNGWPVK